MKNNFLFLLLSIGFLCNSCSKEDEPVLDKHVVRDSNVIDRIADDLSFIAEQEYGKQLAIAAGLPESPVFLPECASVSTTYSGAVWTSIIDFGEMGCAISSGAIITGKITLSGSIDFTTATMQVDYALEGFYYNNNLVEGASTIAFSQQSTPAQGELHLVADMDLDLIVTHPNGNVFQRSGQRIRELTQGYATTQNVSDNVYQISGSWITVFANGTLNTTVDIPLVWFASCPYIGQGQLSMTMNSNAAKVEYGDGTCDYFALLTINSESPETVLLNL